jgi:quercetin dioxygenase-like cupin family protein
MGARPFFHRPDTQETHMRPAIVAALLALVAPTAAPAVEIVPVMSQLVPNLPGKRMTVITVSYRPGETSLPHRHAPSGFLYARVLSGQIRSEVHGQGPARVYGPGEGWTEGPDAHHLVSENASATEPATLLVVFVADDGAVLTRPEQR